MLGMYLLRGGGDDLEPGVLPGRAHAADSHRPYEREVVIQDKSFNADGTLHFPTTRGTFGDTPPDGPFLPTTDVSPIWNPEFFGNTMLVNGVSWPVLPVERRRYRFRVLNACNARTMLLKIASHPKARRPAPAALPIWVIGADGGYLPAPVSLETVVLGPAERLDVIVDFSQVPMGTELYLINEGPDEPFGGGAVGAGFEAADPGSTGQVMKFWVAPATAADHSLPPEQLRLPRPPSLGRASRTRRLSLNEISSEVFEDAPTRGMLGTVRADGTPVPLPWMADVTERPRLGTAEVWELHNVTEDAHPIHLHQVQFQVLDRRAAGGAARPPQPWETGRKDTVVALPGEVTRIKARFDLPGRYVWHCHILDHEDNEMMRPLQVEP
jgi:bilirubin oxidase